MTKEELFLARKENRIHPFAFLYPSESLTYGDEGNILVGHAFAEGDCEECGATKEQVHYLGIRVCSYSKSIPVFRQAHLPKQSEEGKP